MAANIGINGFGRIGRSVLRALYESDRKDLRVIAINDLSDPETLAHLLEFDSVHGRFPGTVEVEDGNLIVNGDRIAVTEKPDPSDLDWADVDIALECTGIFKSGPKAEPFFAAGASKVVISAPAKDVDRTVAFGVNHELLTTTDKVISNASCTTNCLAPVAAILDRSFGIKTGYMTTVHSYTSDQPTHDRPHRDLNRGRAAALSMVPTSTGAASAISEVLPTLQGKLLGSAVRVPVANVSLVDLCVMTERECSVQEVNDAFIEASSGALKGIVDVTAKQNVSSDFNHWPASATIALQETEVTQGGMVRVVAWYDNEWGFSNRMLDVAAHLASLK